MAYDHDQLGFIIVNDLRAALDRAGEIVNQNEAYWMIAMADPQNSGKINYAQFKNLIDEKRANERGTSDDDLLDAFVAMGGEPDGDGAINAEKLIKTIKEEFEMTIDIEKLINEIDEDGSGQIEFGEFTQLLKKPEGEGNDDDDEN